jgi:putative transposase
VAEIALHEADGKPLEIWFADEARIGQKNKITRRWAKRGTRPSAPRDLRTASTYIFGAICPAQGKAAGLVLPRCTTQAMNEHLKEIAQAVAPGAHAVLLLDQAGWHVSRKLQVPANITLLPLPAKAPELNPVENIWQTVCSLPAGWLVHTMQLRGLRRMGRRRASRTGDEPCSRRAKCLSVWIPPS